MRMNRTYLGYAGIAALAVLIIAALAYRAPRAGAPSPAASSTPQETADTAIGQYTERPSSPAVPGAAPAEAPLAEGCGLRFTFVPQAKLVALGSAISYTFTASNRGTQPCENVSFSAYWSDAEAYVSASPAPSASTYYWSLGTLPSRAVRTITASTRVADASKGQVSNEACATADNSQDVCAQNTLFVGSTVGGAAPAQAPAAAPGSATVRAALAGTSEAGLWIWDTPLQMPSGYAARMAEAASANGFNTLYITVDDYLAIAALPAGADKTAKSASYMNALASVIAAAKAKGMQVDIEGGARDWAYPENRWKGYALIDFLAAYNAAHPEAKARGLQYDVEPYLLPEYDGDKVTVLTQFLEFIQESVNRMKGVDGAFSVVIPHFYDSRQAWTPSLSFGGKQAFAFTHLLDILQAKPGSSLIIMAYRNYFEGDGGTRELAAAELDEAAQGGYAARVVVAQETGNVEPSYVTFYGMSKADLAAALGDIRAAFGSNKNFGGVAVHYLEPFLDLK
jgi:uncharacterized repeat protein (TIGR01451 family)